MEKRKLGLHTVLTACSLLFAVIAATTASLAWFASNRRVEDNGLQMQIDGSSVIAMPMTTYWKHLVDERLVYEKSTGAQVALPTYDSVFEEQNEHCEIYLRVPVFGKTVNDGASFTITLSVKDMDAGKGYEGSAANYNHYIYDETIDDETGEAIGYTNRVVSQYLSNVVSVSCGLIPGLNSVDETRDGAAQTIIDTAKTFFKTGGETGEFLTESGEVDASGEKIYDKVGELAFTISSYNSQRILVSEPGDEDVYLVYVYFKIAYDPVLIENLMTRHPLTVGESAYIIQSDFDKFVLDIE